MKSSRMKFAKKLKSIRAGEYLNQDRILQVLSAADGISEFLPKISNPISQITAGSIWRSPQMLEDQIADGTELVENHKEGEEASRCFVGDEENVRPPVNQISRVSCDRRDSKSAVSGGFDAGIGRKNLGSGFRRPELNSTTLFDPKLLEAFELAVVCFRRLHEFSRESRVDDKEDDIVFPAVVSEIEDEKTEKGDDPLPPVIAVNEQEEDRGKDENVLQIAEEVGLEKRPIGEDDCGKDGITLLNPLWEFEERCPPGGEESVVFYTTTLRGIRKTFDDCNMIRFLLDSFKVKYYERDVSMHRHYREELRKISAVEETEVLPPVLFIKGRCIGGAQRVLGLHEQGKLRALFDGIPIAGEKLCQRCDGFRFLVCDGCRGSRRIVSGDGTRIQCLLCNENGLIVCVDCS
uniref:Glutaredoxin domain-containing cysteine-rich protein 1 n=1 Tax=Noccaea caerulescens TaxID=107243 RepID=A0A1J3JEJ3_NOCCA